MSHSNSERIPSKAKFLVGTVDKSQLIRTDSACRDLIDEAKNYLLLPQERGHMQGPRTKPRRPVNPYEVLFAVGGWCSGDAIQTVERYDPIREEWSLVESMNKRRCGVGVAVLGNFTNVKDYILFYTAIQIIWFMLLEAMMVPLIFKLLKSMIQIIICGQRTLRRQVRAELQ